MSSAGPATAASSNGGASSSAGLEPSSGGKSKRGEKKVGKGRRRRSAGEQRRWSQYVDDDDEDFSLVAPSLPSSCGRNPDRHELRQYLNELADDVVDPDVALALSISIAERNSVSEFEGLPASVIAGMTYESLAQLEDVRRVASAVVVTELPVCSFLLEEAEVPDSGKGLKELADDARMCVICQNDYNHGDSQVRLPCLHTFHQVCGAEWLLNYSKLCPICKHDITEVASEAT